MIRRLITTAAVLVGACSLAARAADAPATTTATAPATQPAGADSPIEVQEWVVLLCDPTLSQANARSAFNNTLPEFIGTRRPNAAEKDRNEPRPIGVIRMSGSSDATLKTDVLLEMKGGTFVSHWPKTQPRVNRLLWRNIVLTDKPPTLEKLADNSWLQTVRNGDSAYLTTDRGNERFLLYDIEFPYKSPLNLSFGDGSKETYSVANTSSAPLHDLSIYKPAGEKWSVGSVAAVAQSRSTTKPATSPSTQASTSPASQPATTEATTRDAEAVAQTSVEAATDLIAAAATKPAATQPQSSSATSPSTAPSTSPTSQAATSQPTGVEVKLSAAASDQLLAPWKQVLTDAGLAATDQDLIISILKQQLNPKHATVIYRLDPGELDKLLPIEVVPAPKRITRVALVVVRNADPALVDEIDGLIAQLGDDDYAKREQSFKDLAAFGAAAQPKLNAALKSKDLEVVFRAEQLLAKLNKPGAPAGN